MNKILNILIAPALFLHSFSVFAVGETYLVNVPVTRMLQVSMTSKENEPQYIQSVVFRIDEENLDEIKNRYRNTEYSYFRQTNELLFGEPVQSADFTRDNRYCLGENKNFPLSANIATKDLIEPSLYYYTTGHYANLVTTKPLTVLNQEKPMILSMGTKLREVGDLEFEYAEALKVSKEMKAFHEENKSYFVILFTDQSTGSVSYDNACQLSFLRNLREDEKRQRIIAQARLLLDQPYQWGGKSAFEGHGYDCAALVQIAYLTGAGMDIPRAVFNQAEKGSEISAYALEPGDLLFTLWHRNDRAVDPIHVMIWLGDNRVIEASPFSMTVREASIEEVFPGYSFEKIKDGQQFFCNGKMRSLQFRRLL